jgi:hypothetical protein
MRVVVPYAPGFLHERVVPAILAQGYAAETIECVNIVDHPMSYPRILADLLLGDEDVCIIEHDNESRPGFLQDLEDCPEPWCFFAYDLSQRWEDAVLQPSVTSAPLGVDFAPLGHTRFKAGLGENIRDTLESDWFKSTWVARDTFVAGALSVMGFKAHRHPGKAIHHHPYHIGGYEYRARPMIPEDEEGSDLGVDLGTV